MRVLIVSCLVLMGCGESSPAAVAKDAATDTPIDSAPAPELDEKGCMRLDEPPPADARCIRTLNATVVDDTGALLPDLIVTACGSAGCTFGQTDARGVVAMEVHRWTSNPAMMLHGKAKYASYYMRIDAEGDVQLGKVILPKLPAGTDMVPTDGKPTDLTFGDVTVSLPSGAKVEVDVLEFEEVQQQKFSALYVPLDKAPPWADPSLGLAALYAFNPFATIVSPGAKLTLKNTAKLPAGTAVEFFLHGSSVFDKFGPFGRFTKYADGKVSDDGATIVTTGFDIPELTWIGVRVKK